MKVINCSELSESHTTQRLTGSPPGYVGYREQALIPHDWLHAGRSVIVFDEVEKAHPAVHKLLLGVLEEATLDARNGEKGSEPLHFNNALLFFTSNVGADEMQKIREGKGQLGFRQKEQTLAEQLQAIESVAKTALRKSFAPEFLGRIDDFVTFQPLEKEHYDKIFYKFLEEINADFQQTQPNPTTLLATLDLKEHILEILGKEYGARDMRHLLDTEVLDRFTDVVMEHDVAGAYVIGSYTPDKGVQFYTDRKDTRRLPIEDTVFEPEPKKKRTDVPQQYSHRRRKRRRY